MEPKDIETSRETDGAESLLVIRARVSVPLDGFFCLYFLSGRLLASFLRRESSVKEVRHLALTDGQQRLQSWRFTVSSR